MSDPLDVTDIDRIWTLNMVMLEHSGCRQGELVNMAIAYATPFPPFCDQMIGYHTIDSIDDDTVSIDNVDNSLCNGVR